SGTEPGIQVRISGQGQLDESVTHGPAAAAWWTPAATGHPVLLPGGDPSRSDGPKDAMAVPVPVGDGLTAVMLVTDSLPDIPTFTEEHLRLLQAMANHASVSLAHAPLNR